MEELVNEFQMAFYDGFQLFFLLFQPFLYLLVVPDFELPVFSLLFLQKFLQSANRLIRFFDLNLMGLELALGLTILGQDLRISHRWSVGAEDI